MYSKERAQQITQNTVKYIPAGIQENVALKGARVTTSPNGNIFLEITFEKDGATLPQTEWKPTNMNGMLSNEEVQRKEDTQFSRMMQILRCFYTDDELTFESTDFKGWANEVADYLNKADKSQLLRVKIVYNNKGYTGLPTYAKYTFVEPMSVTKEDSAIIELGIDKFTRPIQADNETPVDKSTYIEDAEDSDLPF